MVNRAAGPTSVNRPKLVLLAVTAARTALPLSGDVATGQRTARRGPHPDILQVSEQMTPPLLAFSH